MAGADTVSVSVVYCAAPGQIDEVQLRLPEGALLLQALQDSGLLQRHSLQLQGLQAGIWGRMQGFDAVLRERDRVEVYRALQVDPKEARRLRYGRHKAAVQARKDRLKQGLTPVDTAAPAAGTSGE